MMPCSRPKLAPITRCSANPIIQGGQGNQGNRPAFDTVLERIAWWAELFQSPCVGYAANLDEVGALAQAGADFVALGDWIWTDAPADSVAAAVGRLAQPV